MFLHSPVLRAGEEVERGPGAVRKGAEVCQGGPVQGQESQQQPQSWLQQQQQSGNDQRCGVRVFLCSCFLQDLPDVQELIAEVSAEKYSLQAAAILGEFAGASSSSFCCCCCVCACVCDPHPLCSDTDETSEAPSPLQVKDNTVRPAPSPGPGVCSLC